MKRMKLYWHGFSYSISILSLLYRLIPFSSTCPGTHSYFCPPSLIRTDFPQTIEHNSILFPFQILRHLFLCVDIWPTANSKVHRDRCELGKYVSQSRRTVKNKSTYGEAKRKRERADNTLYSNLMDAASKKIFSLANEGFTCVSGV